MIRCLECKNIQIKEYPSHAKNGYGRCSISKDGIFYSLRILHNCDKFNEAEKEIIDKRIAWHETIKKGMK